MKKIYNSVRVSYDYWSDDGKFASFLSWLRSWKDCIDQVSFFSSWFHPPMPLETAEKHCNILAERIGRVHELGFSCGINILDTVGHHPEHLDKTLQADYTYMTNIDGEVCLGSRCMNNPDFLDNYVRPLYRLHCAAHPDFIWVDDDIRYGHLPIGYACFCDRCIATFNEKFGYAFSRKSLKDALQNTEDMQVRHDWLTHQSDKIVGIFRVIRETVNECDDSITLGFMTGERYFEGYDFAAFADALSEGGKYEIMWRPGGGAYTDRCLWDQYGKSCEIGRQTANLPPYVTSVQSELENCPYQVLKKSPRATVLEAEMDLACGATATAWNFLPNTGIGEPITLIDRHMAEIRRKNGFIHLLSDTFGRNPLLGIHGGWHIHSQAVGKKFFDGFNPSYNEELFTIGLPEAYGEEGAVCHTLCGRAPLAFSDAELKKILSGPVFLDASAVGVLRQMGYGDYVGFSIEKELPANAETGEVYAAHPINRGFEGHKRVCSSIFCSGSTALLKAPANTEVLCSLVDDDGKTISDCSLGIWNNPFGGRICASSYYTWTELSDGQKSRQMKRLFRALTGGALPAYVESYDRVRLQARQTSAGTVGLILTNMNMDTLENVAVRVSGAYPSARCVNEACEAVTIPGGDETDTTVFTLPQMQPYGMYILLPGEE